MGFQIIIGGDVNAPLSGTLKEASTTHSLEFTDDGNGLDVQPDDNVWVAHVQVTQKGGEAPPHSQYG